MNVLIIAVLFVAHLSTAEAKACAECASDYEGATKGTNDEKCTAIKAFLTCLVDATACPLAADKAALIKTDYDALTAANCPLTEACTCQKDYFQTDQSSDTCGPTKTYMSCLVGKNDKACDDSATVKDLATTAKTITDLDTCSTTDVCDCEITYATADISTEAQRCTAAKNYMSCLVGKTENGCGGSTVKILATAAKAITDPETCSTNDVCNCEITYVTADISTNEKKCTSTTAFETCLNGIDSTTETGCDDTSKTTDLKTKVKDLCSTAGPGLKSSIVISLITLIVSALFSSP